MDEHRVDTPRPIDRHIHTSGRGRSHPTTHPGRSLLLYCDGAMAATAGVHSVNGFTPRLL